MEGYKTYQLYIALKLHFTSDYDYHKYHGKTKAMSESKLSTRPDYHHFRRLERRYPNELEDFFVANMIENKNYTWIGDFVTPEAEKTYKRWKSKKESLKYNIRQELMRVLDEDRIHDDILKVKDGKHPKLLKYYMGNKISIETLIAMNEVINFLPSWKEKINDKIIWPQILHTIEKYKPFLTIDKSEIKPLLRNIFLDSAQ